MLLGHDTLATGGVRERDDQGDHTTVARVMVALPGDAGVIADAGPAQLTRRAQGVSRAFPEIVEASRACRFGDCTHTMSRVAPFARPRTPGRSTACVGNVPKPGVIHARECSNARSRCPSVIDFSYDSRLPTVRETAFLLRKSLETCSLLTC